MIVPQFKIKQNQTQIQLYIRIPYLKVTACQFHIQANCFKFYLKPYLLSLSFKQPLKEVQQPAKAVYYHEKYILQVHLLKQNKGQHFEDLDLLTNIINNKKKTKKISKVQVISGEGVVISKQRLNPFGYGFSFNYTDLLQNLDEQCAELFSFDPRDVQIQKRYDLSNQIIIKQFDYDDYIYDKTNEQIGQIIKLKNQEIYLKQLIQKYRSIDVNSEEYKLKLRISKEVLVSQAIRNQIPKDLFSIVFSYIYQLVCMCGQFGPQSAKTINRTSLLLNCNCNYLSKSEEFMVVDCCKRALTYSLYRSIQVCNYVIQVISKFFDFQNIKIILLDLRKLLQNSEPRYLLNKLYIDDYLVYLYTSGSQLKEQLNKLSKFLKTLKMNQQMLKMKIKQYQQLQLNESNESDTQTPPLNEKQQKQRKQKIQIQHNKLIQQMEQLEMLD